MDQTPPPKKKCIKGGRLGSGGCLFACYGLGVFVFILSSSPLPFFRGVFLWFSLPKVAPLLLHDFLFFLLSVLLICFFCFLFYFLIIGFSFVFGFLTLSHFTCSLYFSCFPYFLLITCFILCVHVSFFLGCRFIIRFIGCNYAISIGCTCL